MGGSENLCNVCKRLITPCNDPEVSQLQKDIVRIWNVNFIKKSYSASLNELDVYLLWWKELQISQFVKELVRYY